MLAKTRFCLAFAIVALLSAAPIYVHGQVSSPAGSSAHETETETETGTADPDPQRLSEVSSAPKVDSHLLQQFLGNCCKNSFLPPKHIPPTVTPPFAPESRRLWSADGSLIAIAVPVYIPYAIGYEPDQTDVGEAGEEGSDSGDNRQPEPRRLMSYDSYADFPADEADDDGEPLPPEEPVVTQPATTLVYRDGHRAEVVNYAIVGDALFDFDDDERTHKIPLADLDLTATAKANDLRGVDFKLPPGTPR